MTDAQWQRKKEKVRLERLKNTKAFVDNHLKPHTIRLAAFRAKNRINSLQAHANSWAAKHEKRRIKRLHRIRGAVDNELHPSSKVFLRAQSDFDPLASHAAKQAEKNERIRLKRLAGVQSTFKTSTINRLHKSTKEFQRWKANSRKKSGDHSNKWEIKHERERLRRLHNTQSSVSTILPRHIQRKREFDSQILRRKMPCMRPCSTRSVHERLKVNGGYLKLMYPPKSVIDSFNKEGEWISAFESESKRELSCSSSRVSAAPMSGIGVHLPEMKSSVSDLKKQAEAEAKSNQKKKQTIFAKILSRALHRETQRALRLKEAASKKERRALSRKFKKEREKCQEELMKLLSSSNVLPKEEARDLVRACGSSRTEIGNPANGDHSSKGQALARKAIGGEE